MPTALITGGSAGLGAAYAEHLAARGYDLVLVARDRARLDGIAERLRRKSGVAVEVIAADLTAAEHRAAVEGRLSDLSRPVDLLVNNAGVKCRDDFHVAPLPALVHEIDLNIVAVMALTRVALSMMMARGEGAILNVASFAGYLSPAGSAYGATKAWVLAFTDSIAASLVGSGVRMLAVCPGRIRFSAHGAGADTNAVGSRSPLLADATEVVARSMADLERGRTLSTPGVAHRAVVAFLEAPRRALRVLAVAVGHGRRQRRRIGAVGTSSRRSQPADERPGHRS